MPHDILKSVFGFDTFRPGQLEVIEKLLAGRSAVAIFPTGGGKSLCYQIPALMLEGVTLVISPLIALMKDQIDMLVERGVAAARLDSTQDADTVRQVYADLQAGRLKLLYVAPERLANERFLARLARLPLSLLAVDEAHCISEWGHNFRPDYLKIAGLARQLHIPRVLGLTATATPEVAAGIVKAFDMGNDSVVHTGFYRPNLTLYVTPTVLGDRETTLLGRLQTRPAGPTIVYVTLQKTAESVAEFLAKHGLSARPYHAGLDPAERSQTQDWFMASSDAIVVATIAFGMGIDKSDIRYVYHYNLPKSLENYAQEIGRAGRDGQTAICEMLASAEDATVLENFVYGDTPDPSAIAALVGLVLAGPHELDVSISELASQCDIRPLVVETVLAYLELEGVLASTAPFYNEYKLQLKQPLPALLAGFDEGRRKFLAAMLQMAKKGPKWLKLDVTSAAAALGERRDRLVTALNYLEERGQLTLQVAGVRQGYRLLQMPGDVQALHRTLADRFLARETADLHRVGTVLAFTQDESCYTHRLWAYFGESRDGGCGHCGFCEGLRAESQPGRRPLTCSVPPLPDSPALATPRQKARFLCGLSSPMASRARLVSHPLFGRLAEVPFQAVLSAVQAAGS